MKNKTTKEMDKKTLFILLSVGLIITIIGILFIGYLEEILADLTLPDTLKKYYSIYTLEANGVDVPCRMEYLTNNGKLFAFCHSLSSVFVAIILYKSVNVFGKKIYKKCDNNTVRIITKRLGLIVLLLGVFTFTSKINRDNNFEKYVVELNPSDYSKKSELSDENRFEITGYFKAVDLEKENHLIAVYEAPAIESALEIVEEKDYIGRFFVYLIKNIDKINEYSEMVTIILGIYIFVLNKFQKEHKQ